MSTPDRPSQSASGPGRHIVIRGNYNSVHDPEAIANALKALQEEKPPEILARGKTCPICKKKCAPNASVCPQSNCGHDFEKAKKAQGQRVNAIAALVMIIGILIALKFGVLEKLFHIESP